VSENQNDESQTTEEYIREVLGELEVGESVTVDVDESLMRGLAAVDTVEVEDATGDEVTIVETTAQRIVRELREKFEAEDEAKTKLDERLAKQFEAGIVSPMTFAAYLEIRPQMIYQAIRDGKLKTVLDNNTQKRTISVDEAARWGAAYLDRKYSREAAKVQAAEVELQG
jgi:hypothetical protein